MKKKEYKAVLIAMSGVRVYNKKLMHLGLTLPGFVDRSKVIANLPSLDKAVKKKNIKFENSN